MGRLVEHPLVQTAARYGATFKVDPLAALDCTPRDWDLRLAMLKVVHDDHKRATSGGGSGDD